MNIDDIKRFIAIKKELDDIAIQEAELKRERQELEQIILAEFEEQGVQNMRVDGRTVSLVRTIYARANTETGGTEALAQVLRENGLADLVKDSVNANTLASYVRELEKLEIPMPEAIANHVIVTPVFSARVKKAG